MVLLLLVPLLLIMPVFLTGTFVFARNPKNSVTRIFLFYSVIGTLIALSEYEFIISGNSETASSWLRFHLPLWPVLFAAQFHFLLVYTKSKFSEKPGIFFFVYFIAVLVSVNTFLNKPFLNMVEVGFGFVRNPLEKIDLISEIVFAAFMTFFTLLLSVIGFIYVNNSSEIEKERTKAYLVLSGLLIPAWLPFFKNAFLPLFDIVVLFPDFQFFFVGWTCFAFAIWRYEALDITAKTTADEIVSTMKEALMLADEDGTIISGNDAFYNLFGFTRKEIAGKSVDDFFKLSPDAEEKVGKRYKSEETANSVCTFNTKNKKVAHLNLSVSFLKNERDQVIGFVFLMNDISELKEAEDQLRDQQKKLVDMARQAGMAEIATNTMHNIGNIMNSVNISSEQFFEILGELKINEFKQANELILANRDNLHEFLTVDEKGKLLPEYLTSTIDELEQQNQTLKSEGNRLVEKIKLIGETIELQQAQTKQGGRIEQVRLIALIDSILQVLDNDFLKNSVMISKNYAISDSVTVKGQKAVLFNIFLNIIKNAHESVLRNPVTNRRIGIELVGENTNIVRINISDNGPGIEEKKLPEIFKFGVTTKKNHHGFGLYYCITNIKELNGSIDVKKKETGEGIIFSVRIPVT